MIEQLWDWRWIAIAAMALGVFLIGFGQTGDD